MNADSTVAKLSMVIVVLILKALDEYTDIVKGENCRVELDTIREKILEIFDMQGTCPRRHCENCCIDLALSVHPATHQILSPRRDGSGSFKLSFRSLSRFTEVENYSQQKDVNIPTYLCYDQDYKPSSVNLLNVVSSRFTFRSIRRIYPWTSSHSGFSRTTIPPVVHHKHPRHPDFVAF